MLGSQERLVWLHGTVICWNESTNEHGGYEFFFFTIQGDRISQYKSVPTPEILKGVNSETASHPSTH